MDIKRWIGHFISRVFVPTLTYTLLERLTAHVVVALGGAVAVVTLAFLFPEITTGLKSLDHLIEGMRRQRRRQYLDEMCAFLNAYLDILTQYPPAILPDKLSRCVEAHIDVFAHAFQTLRARRSHSYASRYDMIRALRFQHCDFAGWRLAACEAWWAALLTDLSQIADNPMRRTLQLGLDQADAHLRQYHLDIAQNRFSRALGQALEQHPALQRICACDALRQRVLDILELDIVPGQAQLQVVLQQHAAFESDYDVQELIALLRHDVVADAVRAHLAASPTPSNPAAPLIEQ